MFEVIEIKAYILNNGRCLFFERLYNDSILLYISGEKVRSVSFKVVNRGLFIELLKLCLRRSNLTLTIKIRIDLAVSNYLRYNLMLCLYRLTDSLKNIYVIDSATALLMLLEHISNLVTLVIRLKRPNNILIKRLILTYRIRRKL